KTTVRTTLTVAILCLFASVAATQTKPNLNGTWKMDPSKSKFENEGPGSITIKFEQKATSFNETLTIGGDNDERNINLKYTTDSKEYANQIGDRDVQVTAKWEGETLVVTIKGEQGIFTRKLSISTDGKTINMDVERQEGDRPMVKESVFLVKQ